MNGEASATKEASPTPTNMRHVSRLQKPAGKNVVMVTLLTYLLHANA